MKILISGCLGFIGSNLCEYLLENKITVINKIKETYDDIVISEYKILGIDIEKKDTLEILEKYEDFVFFHDDLVTTNVITIEKPDIIIHLGAKTGVRHSVEHPESHVRVNVEGHTHFLKESVDNNVKRFVYASSSSVYGTNIKTPFSEDDKIESIISPYAATKKMGEDMAMLFNKIYGLSVVGLRFFTVYGKRGREDMAPYIFLHNIHNEIPIKKFGDGTSLRDYTYVNDIIEGILLSIFLKGTKICKIYNLGCETPITLNNFIELCEKTVGKKAIIDQHNNQIGDVSVTYADITKAKEELNYVPKTVLEDGLKIMFDWMTKN